MFIIDDEPAQPFQIYGFSKLSGNTSRYGVPHGQIDQAHFYLGSLDNYLAGEPTLTGEETYDKVSRASLEESQAAIEASGLIPGNDRCGGLQRQGREHHDLRPHGLRSRTSAVDSCRR